MYSQREQISMKSKLESIEAQLNYIKVQLSEIDYILRTENKKNDQLIEEQLQTISLTNTLCEKENITKYYIPFHEAFCELIVLKQAEKQRLVEEQKKLTNELLVIKNALSADN